MQQILNISNCHTKRAGCLSAVYALMVDWQLGVRMVWPGPFYMYVYQNFFLHDFFFQLKEVEDYNRKEREQQVQKSNSSSPVKRVRLQ